MIEHITDNITKQNIVKEIINSLTEWFELEEGRTKYIEESKDQILFADQENNKYIGFICLKEISKDTVEISVMGVLKEYQRKGIGCQLFTKAKEYVKQQGYSFIEVKTVASGYYKEYDITNKFYQKLGFKELEIIPTIWDEQNPCQIYIMSV